MINNLTYKLKNNKFKKNVNNNLIKIMKKKKFLLQNHLNKNLQNK